MNPDKPYHLSPPCTKSLSSSLGAEGGITVNSTYNDCTIGDSTVAGIAIQNPVNSNFYFHSRPNVKTKKPTLDHEVNTFDGIETEKLLQWIRQSLFYDIFMETLSKHLWTLFSSQIDQLNQQFHKLHWNDALDAMKKCEANLSPLHITLPLNLNTLTQSHNEFLRSTLATCPDTIEGRWSEINNFITPFTCSFFPLQYMCHMLDYFPVEAAKLGTLEAADIDNLLITFKGMEKATEQLFKTQKELELMKRLQHTLQEHTKINLSHIRIPASDTFLDLNEAVLNQSMSKLLIRNQNKRNFMQDVKDKQKIFDDGNIQSNEQQSNVKGAVEQQNPAHSYEDNKVDARRLKGVTIPIRYGFFEDDDFEPFEDDLEPSEDDNFVYIHFKEMRDVIEAEIGNNQKEILITAAGGRGKTTAARKLMLQWANKLYLQNFFVVIFIDMKQVQYDKNITENMMDQYSIIENEFSYSEIKEAFRVHHGRVMWMLDGIDESQSHTGAEKFILNSKGSFPRSVFLMLTREEGKPIIGSAKIQASEFRMNNLNENQCEMFTKVFPFRGKNAEKKRNVLIKARKTNPALQTAFPIPINAAMICRLFDEETFDGDVQNELDIVEGILAVTLKATEIKNIDIALDKPHLLSTNKLPKLNEKRKTIVEKNLKHLMTERSELLIKLAEAIFIYNGNSFVGFQKMEKSILRAELAKIGVSDEDQNFLLRMDIFDQQTDGQKTFFQFFHRNIREFTVALSGSNIDNVVTPQGGTSSLTASHLSVFRCILAQILRCEKKKNLNKKVLQLATHFLHQCKNANEWEVAQLLCDIIQFGCYVGREYFDLSFVLKNIINILEDAKIAFNTEVIKTLKSNYLEKHLIYGEISCSKCIPPKTMKNERQQPQNQHVSHNWPENKPFTLLPFLLKKEDCIMFTIPKGIFSKHVSLQSKVVYCKRYAEIKFGRGMIAESIQERIVVWGGNVLNKEYVHIHNVEKKLWKKIPAKGDLHPGSEWAASVTHRDQIHIFGGFDKNDDLNSLSTLSLNGEFRRVAVQGDLPLPRSLSVGWTHDDNLFFGFGYSHGRGHNEEEKYIQGGDWENDGRKGCTNEVLKFDLKSKSWSFFDTNGSLPLPRRDCACAKLGTRVYIHGGECALGNKKHQDNFFVLNVITRQWTKINDFGHTIGFLIANHTLTPIGSRQIMFLGGAKPWFGAGTYADTHVKLYNVENSTWEKCPRLPEEFCRIQEERGLRDHKAVAVRQGDCVTKVVCIGGYVKGEEYSTKLLEFKI